MKILLTGSDGFIGSMIKPVLEKKYDVVPLKSDLRNHQAVRHEVVTERPHVIMHFAARTEVEQSFKEPLEFSNVNYIGTQNLIESARLVPRFECFIHASTMEVYGRQPISDEVIANKIPEKFIAFNRDTPCKPNAPYAVAKYAAEKYLQYASSAYGLNFIAFRQTNIYGRTNSCFFVTESIISQMLNNPDEINLGYAEPYRNFLHVDDLIDLYVTSVEERDRLKNLIYTIGPDEPIKIRDYANIIADKIGWSGTINWDTRPERKGEFYWLNSENEVEKQIGWKPKISLDEGLDRTIEYWKHTDFKGSTLVNLNR